MKNGETTAKVLEIIPVDEYSISRIRNGVVECLPGIGISRIYNPLTLVRERLT
jgi:hypothetical protein